jgi:hypothetical protein
VLVPPERARYSREHVGSDYISWLHFQPIYDRLVLTDPDMRFMNTLPPNGRCADGFMHAYVGGKHCEAVICLAASPTSCRTARRKPAVASFPGETVGENSSQTRPSRPFRQLSRACASCGLEANSACR